MESRTSHQSPMLRPGEVAILFGIAWTLVSILWPIVSRPHTYSGPTFMSNMHQVGAALQLYAQDNDGYLPTGNSPWPGTLKPYVGTTRVYCDPHPLAASLSPPLYEIKPDTCRMMGLNKAIYGLRLSDLRHNTVLLAEVHYRYKQPMPWSAREFYVPLDRVAPDNAVEQGWKSLGPPAAVRRNGRSSYVFADGHAKLHRPDEVYSVANPGEKSAPGFAP